MDGRKGEMVSMGMSQARLPARFLTSLAACRALHGGWMNPGFRLHFLALQILQQQNTEGILLPSTRHWTRAMLPTLLPESVSSWDNCSEPCGLPVVLYKTSLGKHRILGQHILNCACHGRPGVNKCSVQYFSTEGQCSAF